jgi:hypothetical protein
MTKPISKLKDIKPTNAWSEDEIPSNPSAVEEKEGAKPSNIKTVSKSFSIPPSLLDDLEKEAAKRIIETGLKISVSKILVEFVRKGMKK